MRRQGLQGKEEEDEEDEGGEEAEKVVPGAVGESHLLSDRSWYLIEDGHHIQGRGRLRLLLKNMTMRAPD